MNQSDPIFTSDVPSKRRKEVGWGARILGVLIRLAVLALVVMTVLLSLELIDRAKERTVIQHAKQKALEEELEKQELELRLQRDREQRLLNDPTYLEYVARDQLDLARPGETVIIIDEDDDDSNVKD